MSRRHRSKSHPPDLLGITKLRRMSTDVNNANGDYFDQLLDELESIRRAQADMMKTIAEMQCNMDGDSESSQDNDSSSTRLARHGRHDPQPKNLREVFAMIDASRQYGMGAASVHARQNGNRGMSDDITVEAKSVRGVVTEHPIRPPVDVNGQDNTADASADVDGQDSSADDGDQKNGHSNGSGNFDGGRIQNAED